MMTQMNVQLANVFSDLSGMTGQAIVKAILAGERDGHKLAGFGMTNQSECGGGSAESGGQLAGRSAVHPEAGTGGLSILPEADGGLRPMPEAIPGAARGPQRRARRCRKRRGSPRGGRRSGGMLHNSTCGKSLFRMTGVDLTRIDGIDVVTAATVVSEAGWDMSKWRTEDHLVSWLRLCPDNRISGEKVIGKGRLPTNNRLTIAFKMAASTLRQSNTYLGAQFRRLRTRLGAPVAIKAMAARLARLVYRMLRYGMKFVDQGAEFYEAQHRKLQINYLKWKAGSLGFQIIEAPAA